MVGTDVQLVEGDGQVSRRVPLPRFRTRWIWQAEMLLSIPHWLAQHIFWRRRSPVDNTRTMGADDIDCGCELTVALHFVDDVVLPAAALVSCDGLHITQICFFQCRFELFDEITVVCYSDYESNLVA
jgi:hypothetical protein